MVKWNKTNLVRVKIDGKDIVSALRMVRLPHGFWGLLQPIVKSSKDWPLNSLKVKTKKRRPMGHAQRQKKHKQ